jgi:hypothetical protein
VTTRVAFAAIFCAGCISQRVLPAPAAPLPIEPRIDGAGNVVLDVTGQQHAHAYAVQKIGTPEEELVLLCTTPCAVTLQPGMYTLRFTSQKNTRLTSTADIDVPARGKILVRHALGLERPMPSAIGFSGLLLGSVGIVGTLIGVSTVAAGGSTAASANSTRAVGGVMLGLGVVMFSGAWALLRYGRGVRQDGATTVSAL